MGAAWFEGVLVGFAFVKGARDAYRTMRVLASVTTDNSEMLEGFWVKKGAENTVAALFDTRSNSRFTLCNKLMLRDTRGPPLNHDHCACPITSSIAAPSKISALHLYRSTPESVQSLHPVKLGAVQPPTAA
jgi:hypothetical protein